MRETILEIKQVKKYFLAQKSPIAARRRYLKAVDGVTLSVGKGETVGLVGESGCGKSTLGRTVLRLHEMTGGSVVYRGTALESLPAEEMRQMRRKLQMIFQDPYASLNPRSTVFSIVKSSLDVFGLGTAAERAERTQALLSYVGLDAAQMYKFPHEMSGGQRQRVAIARALILNPEFIVCDEPVSALDVSVRAQVLNLMKEMQRDLELSYLFISHDLSVVRYLCDKVAVMYLGKLVELGDKEEIFSHPAHPYTRALLSAIPVPETGRKRSRILLSGDVPSPMNPPSGCRFHTRCPYAEQSCRETEPEMRTLSAGHQVACLKEIDGERPSVETNACAKERVYEKVRGN